MDAFNSRGLNIFRLLLIFALLVSLFCFRDLWIPSGQEKYPNGDPIPHPPQQTQEELLYHTSTLPPSASITPPTTPISPQSSLTTQTYAYEEEEEKGEEKQKDSVSSSPSSPFKDDCRSLPGADKVMVMLKTGATEIYSKLPTHLLTTFTCIPNFQIYSDLAQTFAKIPVHDIIAPVSFTLRETHSDFTLYKDLQRWQREGQDLSKLKGDNGWNLDKWKFLPMLHHAYEVAPPEIEWFVMIEADTALSWLNLLPWLQTMDPSKPRYMGSQNLLGDLKFAHGGSGIIISRGAMDTLEGARTSIGAAYYDSKWEEATARSCCGDAILAEALKAVDVDLEGVWPVIQGETISTIDFKRENWCKVPATWHHVSPIQVDAHWKFQVEWAERHGWETPFLYRDVFERFVAQHVSVNRTKWNNLSNDWKFTSPRLVGSEREDREANMGLLYGDLEEYERESVESEEACARACAVKKGLCVQWMWTPGRCHLGRELRLGASDERNEIEVQIGERMSERDYWNCGWVEKEVERLRGKRCESRGEWW